ncbi:MAG: hypothetical protein R2834_09180 [Rhodothermales bacterium]
MHRSILFTLLLLLPAVAGAQSIASSALETRDGVYYLQGAETPFSGAVEDPGQLTGRLENGRRVGRWTSWHDNGVKAWEYDYEAGVLTHRAIWHENGQLYTEGDFVAGQPAGLHKRWAPEGHVTEELHYREGKLDGERIVYHPDGYVLLRSAYRAGQKDGTTIWYYPDGNPRWETQYTADLRSGTWTQRDPDGEVFMESTWEDGALVGRHSPHAEH